MSGLPRAARRSPGGGGNRESEVQYFWQFDMKQLWE
jgi:hypothetical protein